MKNVIIPTDFTLDSLENIGRLAESRPKEKLNITMVHFIKLSDSIPELLLLAQRTKERELITDDFILQCEKWRRQYGSQIQSLQVECFYGSTAAVFKNYLEAKEIDAIAHAPGFAYEMACKNSFDPAAIIARSGVEIITLVNTGKTEVEENLEIENAEERLVASA